MSSWVEAAWIIQRISEQLNIPEKLSEYTQQVTELIDYVEELQSYMKNEAIQADLTTVAQISQTLSEIQNKSNIIINSDRVIIGNGIDTNSGAIPPSNIYKNSIWFSDGAAIRQQNQIS